MLFSDAISLGMTLAKLAPGAFHHQDGSVCAVGAGELAVGIKTVFKDSAKIENADLELEEDCNKSFASSVAAALRWPWLNEIPEKLPCGCINKFSYGVAITHIFDLHVCRIDPFMDWKPWTVEQLIAWIKSIEPSEKVTVPSETPTVETGVLS